MLNVMSGVAIGFGVGYFLCFIIMIWAEVYDKKKKKQKEFEEKFLELECNVAVLKQKVFHGGRRR